MPGELRDGKRGVILRAARNLFLEHGFAKTSVDAVVRLAGVSKPTVYAYFPHKEALLDAVVREEAAQILAVLDLKTTGDARADLGHLARLMARMAVAPEVIAWDRMVSAEARRSPVIGQLFYDVGPGTILKLLVELFQRLNQTGALAIPDVHEAAEFFFGMLVGLPILRSQLCGDRPEFQPSEARVDRAVELFLRAYPAGPSNTKPKGKRSSKP